MTLVVNYLGLKSIMLVMTLMTPNTVNPFLPSRSVIGKTEQPRAGRLSLAGLHDNNKDQFDFGSKMQK